MAEYGVFSIRKPKESRCWRALDREKKIMAPQEPSGEVPVTSRWMVKGWETDLFQVTEKILLLAQTPEA